MSKRTLTFGIVLMSAFGCSSSNNTPSDGGKKNDGGGDGATVDGGGDTASDVAKSDAPTDTPVDAPTDGSALTPVQQRGSYLVNAVIGCPDCHTPMGADGMPVPGKFLAGNASFIVLPSGDKLPTRNLTNDATGLKNRTDDQIKDMFLNGKRPLTTDGGTGTEPLNPVMPYYVFHNMKTEDADAIVAYLRTVPGVNNEIPRRSASFDVPMPASYVDPDKIPLPLDNYPARESALRGRYLAGQSGLCIECHTKHQMVGDPIDPTQFFAGGEDFSSFFATTIMIHPVSKNLTSDTATGLGTWTVTDVVNVLTMSKAKDGTGICPPMPTGDYKNMLASDVMDIANYIKSLPPIVHMVPDMCVFPPMAPPDGGMSEAGSDAVSGDATGN
jgi:hypothetical protein